MEEEEEEGGPVSAMLRSRCLMSKVNFSLKSNNSKDLYRRRPKSISQSSQTAVKTCIGDVALAVLDGPHDRVDQHLSPTTRKSTRILSQRATTLLSATNRSQLQSRTLREKGLQGWALQVLRSWHLNELSQVEYP